MLIDLATAKLHLRVDGTADDTMIALYIGAAESAAAQFLNRNIYADSSARTTARDAIPAALAIATLDYEAEIDAVEAMTVGADSYMARLAADESYTEAKTAARMTYQGIVINDQIKAAILLTIGHLFENREDSIVGVSAIALPMGCDYLLQPFRAY